MQHKQAVCQEIESAAQNSQHYTFMLCCSCEFKAAAAATAFLLLGPPFIISRLTLSTPIAAAAAAAASVLPLVLKFVVHFSTMMMQTAWLRLLTSFILVAPVARCRMLHQQGTASETRDLVEGICNLAICSPSANSSAF